MSDVDLEYNDQDSSVEDFDTESDVENASEHEATTYEWPRPAAWAAQLRKNPDIAKFAAPWTAPARRDSIPSLHTDAPDQEPTFNIEPTGSEPFALMFLDALPLEAYWQNVVVRETGRYADLNEATPGRADGQRSWENARINTVSNWLRAVASVIMRGLVPATSDAKFFANETHVSGNNRYSRPGAQKVCGIHINTYEQLMRYQHLVDSTTRACNEANDHDKAWTVRPTLKFLNAAFKRWYNPGRDHALDEGGLPSRHTWLRIRNPEKPHRYFIELLMACCSKTRFCWHFMLNEGKNKIVERAQRDRGQTKYTQVAYYQQVYNAFERDVQLKYGVGAAHMLYFSRVLRTFDDDPDQSMCYRVFTDRRWCSLPAMYLAKKMMNVSFTCSVQDGSRFHISNLLPVIKSRKRSLRGKYRSAYLQIDDDVRITTVLWNDSAKCGFSSADVGTVGESHCIRRVGRWSREVTYPKIVAMREKKFRAIDRHDQLRLGKCHFDYICRKKAWPKVQYGGIELLLVNIYIIAHASIRFRGIDQREFRWQTVLQLVTIADNIDARARAANPALVRGRDCTEGRFQGQHTHHHATWPEYVDRDQLVAMRKRMEDNPGRERAEKNDRNRDARRLSNNKVRNPAWYESNCIVCWARGKSRRTGRYCQECALDPSWTFKCRIGGWANECQPRLCSKACWTAFHTQRINLLDFNHRRKKRPRAPQSRRRNSRGRARRGLARRPNARRRVTLDEVTSDSPEPSFGSSDEEAGATAAPAAAPAVVPVAVPVAVVYEVDNRTRRPARVPAAAATAVASTASRSTRSTRSNPNPAVRRSTRSTRGQTSGILDI